MSRSKQEAGYRREVGWFGSFSLGYGDVGPNIFIALGVITMFAGGAAPISFLIAALLYTIVGLIYAELAPTYPYAGGVHVYSMKAFNSLVGFLAGWAMLLAYILCISLFAVAAAGYLRQLVPFLVFPDLKLNGVVIPSLGMLAGFLALLLVVLNIIGIKYSAIVVSSLVFLGLFIEALILSTGFLLKFDLSLFLKQVFLVGSHIMHKDVSYIPALPANINNFLYSVTLAMASFVGIESIAQAAEETRRPHFSIPRAAKMVVLVVAVSAVLFPVLAVGSMSWEEVAAAYDSPVYEFVRVFPTVGEYLTPLVGLAAFILCYSSSNTGLVGVSRLTASMARFRLLPGWLRVIHPRFRTPARTIVLFGAVGVALSFLGDVPLLASVYAFSAVLSYVILAPTFLKLRQIDREVFTPWRQPFNLRIAGHDVPLLGIAGTVGLTIVFALMLLFHAGGRAVGLLWMLAGMLFYVSYRGYIRAPFLSREEAKLIEPLSYRIKVGILIRPYENPQTAYKSILHAFDKRFDLTLVSVIEKPLNLADDSRQMQRQVLEDMTSICKRLKHDGYNAKCVVEVGDFEESVSKLLDGGVFDLAAFIQRRAEKSVFEKGHEKNIHNLITRYPGRVVSLKRVGE
ncbi:MAG: APC family permease [Candidatus Caldarchaeum sp.]